jgi:hypothetical protein
MGYETVRQRFVPTETGYRFVLSPNAQRVHQNILWVDVCEELGGILQSVHVEQSQCDKPFGYRRYILAKNNAHTSD